MLKVFHLDCHTLIFSQQSNLDAVRNILLNLKIIKQKYIYSTLFVVGSIPLQLDSADTDRLGTLKFIIII